MSLVLIMRALASILAPVSPMQLPLMSILVRSKLLPKQLMRVVVPVFSLESHTDRDSKGYQGKRRELDMIFMILANWLIAMITSQGNQ